MEMRKVSDEQGHKSIKSITITTRIIASAKSTYQASLFCLVSLQQQQGDGFFFSSGAPGVPVLGDEISCVFISLDEFSSSGGFEFLSSELPNLSADRIDDIEIIL